MSRGRRAASEESRLYSNWGRWGQDEAPSALHFVTAEQVLAACGLPRRGWTIPCSLAPGVAGAPDRAVARLAAAAPVRGPFAGRGVLLDLARMARRSRLSDGEEVGPEVLDECAERQGVAVESGDLLLVRTGLLGSCAALAEWAPYWAGPAPGLSPRCARWLWEREVALLGADTAAVEVRPAEDAGRPLREIALEHTGVVFGENFQLDALGEACAADGDYAFLLVCPAPEPATAGAVYPVALK